MTDPYSNAATALTAPVFDALEAAADGRLEEARALYEQAVPTGGVHLTVSCAIVALGTHRGTGYGEVIRKLSDACRARGFDEAASYVLESHGDDALGPDEVPERSGQAHVHALLVAVSELQEAWGLSERATIDALRLEVTVNYQIAFRNLQTGEYLEDPDVD